MSIYDFNATKADGTSYSLAEYQDKVIIVVNTATKCGLAPQFEELEKIYQTYKDQGLVILGFPSNQFKQELSDGEQAQEACRLDYGVTFPMHDLVKVNGADADPMFEYLKAAAPGSLGKTIKWNFNKFLISRDGKAIKRFSPQTSPEKMIEDIEKLL